jgi:hypothetical protein
MKKLLFSLATVLLASAAFGQNTTEVQVVVKNYTNYNLYFAPRYNIGFTSEISNTNDLLYQQEGQFEMVPPQTVQQYSNGNTYPGVPLVPNSVDPVFDSSGTMMQGFTNDPNWFLKYMKFSWIRFSLSETTNDAGFYGGGLAYGFDANGLTQITPSPANIGPFYTDGNGEIYHYYWPSSLSFTINGTTFYAEFITAPATSTYPATIHIVFWQ